MNEDIPCCQRDAIRRIKQITVNGEPTAIVMLDEIIAEVKGMQFISEQEVRNLLMKKVRIYNYIPLAAEEMYSKAILGEYHLSKVK